MLLDDDRPEPPGVSSALPRPAGVALSLMGHAIVVLLVLLGRSSQTPNEATILTPVAPREEVRYVDVRPPVDRVRPPRLLPDPSDLDRRAASPQPRPEAESPVPYSLGNTPDRVVGAPDTHAAPPASAPGADTPRTPVATKVVPDLTAAPERPPLGEALRDLRRFLQQDNLQNPNGGKTEQEPDISFDSKGVEFGPWLRRFVAQVKRNWFVPQAAFFMKGRVVITFNVHRNGTITDLTVIKSSGVESFDASSYNALRLSNPLQPLPAEYPLDKAFFTVTFHYNER
jgi:TonB family protein